jgi:hypothetical protein
MKPSDHFASLLRAESRHCHNVNAAALLQEVAAWLDGGTIFDGERQELWEHADRLCGIDGANKVYITGSAAKHCHRFETTGSPQ